MSGIDARDLRNACGSFATGVTVITTRTPEGDHGMTANAFMSVSLDPPLISISLDHKSKMRARIKASGRYAVSILGHDMEHVARHFAGRHDESLTAILEDRDDLPVVARAATVFLTEVVQEVEAGDHTLFIGRVTHLERRDEAEPLLFCGGKFARIAAR